MRPSTGEVVFSRSPHLVELIADVERLAERVRDHAPARAAASTLDALRSDAAFATLRLDGARIDAMANALEDAPDDTITALEYRGVTAALAADDLADALLVTPLDALAELHARLTAGLLDETHAGRPRETEQAVHDASVGRIIYFPAEPHDIPTRMNLLAAWLQTVGAREHAVVASGVLHYELLHIHPFEAANGRLARAAARLVLRGRGLDPDGAGVPEVALARDPIGYYEEVAKTVRRRDLTIWIERWGEAVVSGLREALERFGLTSSEVSERPAGFLERWDQQRFTVADYRAVAAAGPEDSRSDLRELLDAGHIRRVPGSRGLRYELVA